MQVISLSQIDFLVRINSFDPDIFIDNFLRFLSFG